MRYTCAEDVAQDDLEFQAAVHRSHKNHIRNHGWGPRLSSEHFSCLRSEHAHFPAIAAMKTHPGWPKYSHGVEAARTHSVYKTPLSISQEPFWVSLQARRRLICLGRVLDVASGAY